MNVAGYPPRHRTGIKLTSPPAPPRGGGGVFTGRRLNPEAGPVDLDHCPTCGQEWLACGAIYPPLAQDVVPVRCQLPRGHCSAEHYHPSLWPSTPSLLWFDDE